MAGEEERDPLHGEDDPWAGTRPTAPHRDAAADADEEEDASAAASRATRIAASARGSSRTFATGERNSDAPPMRVLHDNPPSWSGEHPDKKLEPYLKLLTRLVDDHLHAQDSARHDYLQLCHRRPQTHYQ